MSVILIVYVASRSVIFALERSSFAVIVMFRVSPKVASEVLWLLLYMVRFESAGNSLTVNQAQLDSPNITIDKNVPSVTNLTLYSNNSNSSLARAGDLTSP